MILMPLNSFRQVKAGNPTACDANTSFYSVSENHSELESGELMVGESENVRGSESEGASEGITSLADASEGVSMNPCINCHSQRHFCKRVATSRIFPTNQQRREAQ